MTYVRNKKRPFATSKRDLGTKAGLTRFTGATARRYDMAKDHGSSIKDDETYEELRKQGESKEKAARIANAQANSDQNPSEKGGQAPPYEEWHVDELYDRAKELGIEGRSDMDKDELIEALRNH
tara:strand:- start:27 stop:398 length:372 start_codon:yes stop_codon:yes gene_type:complete